MSEEGFYEERIIICCNRAFRAEIYELILKVITIDKDGTLQRYRTIPCASKTCKLFGAEDSYFCCTPTLIAWLEEEI